MITARLTKDIPPPPGEWWVTDDAPWEQWCSDIDAAIRFHDAWALLVQDQRSDLHVVDVFDGWRDRFRSLNARRVWLLRFDPDAIRLALSGPERFQHA